ncbi:MAG: tetratricopeptide repeat protein [Candidatus Aminicenantaceae bacterium]
MKTKSFFTLFSFIFLFHFIFTGSAEAQAGRGVGRLSGVVLDENGNPLESIKVVLKFLENKEITRETLTDEHGEWAFLGLGTGGWRVIASSEGYIPAYEDVYVQQLQKNPKVELVLKKSKQVKVKKELDIIEKADNLYEEEKYDEAIQLLEQYLQKYPEVYQIHFIIGDCYREKGNFDRAIEEYNKIIDRSKEEGQEIGDEIAAKALSSIGECYLRKDDFETAQNYFEQSVDAYPDNEIVAYNVGEIYFSNLKTEEAIDYFQLASQIKPSWSDPYYKLGYVYLNKGDFKKALESFELFLKYESNTKRAAEVQNIIEYLKTLIK